jgi:hypothetical protein
MRNAPARSRDGALPAQRPHARDLDATLTKYGIALPQSREVATAVEAAAAPRRSDFRWC